jgi:hypothetical protein
MVDWMVERFSQMVFDGKQREGENFSIFCAKLSQKEANNWQRDSAFSGRLWGGSL